MLFFFELSTGLSTVFVQNFHQPKINMTMSKLPIFSPKFYLRNPHIQTILPRFIKQPKPIFRREYHKDSTNMTYVAYDFLIQNISRNIIVMFHGLEGSSQSPYAIAFANYAKSQQKNFVIVHYRGCGGMQNHAPKDYHAGDIEEMAHTLCHLSRRFDGINAVGISLGGNMLARYMGEYADHALCQKAVVISAPVDLTSAAQVMKKLIARHIYAPFLLKTLIPKALSKTQTTQHSALRKLKSLDEFDELYTAPRHGFGTASNYYQSTSALPVLKNITKPTLIISSADDPFLGKVAHAHHISPQVQLLYSLYGGHVGFLDITRGKFDLNYLPKTTLQFFDDDKCFDADS